MVIINEKCRPILTYDPIIVLVDIDKQIYFPIDGLAF